MRSVLVIARLTVREAMGARVAVVAGAAAGAVVVASSWLRNLGFGVPEQRLLLDFGYGALSVGGMVLAVLGTTHLLFADRESRRLQVLLARPVERSDYLVGKLAGMLVVLAGFAGVVWLTLAGVLVRHAGVEARDLPWREIAQGGLLLWVKLAVVAGLALFTSCLAGTALIANAAAFGLVVAGHLKAVAGAPGGAGIEGVLAASLVAVPDLRAFEPAGVMAVAGAPPAAVAAYGAAFVVLFTLAACLAFQRREI